VKCRIKFLKTITKTIMKFRMQFSTELSLVKLSYVSMIKYIVETKKILFDGNNVKARFPARH